MAIYRTFYVLSPSKTKGNDLIAKTIDITSIESWEYSSKEYTRVRMKSGDKFVVKCPMIPFGEMVYGFVDGYGKLLTFNNKN